MTSLDNYRTHYCPDSGFSLISENDFEFERCNCFTVQAESTAVSGAGDGETVAGERNRLATEEKWYRTLAALARVCGIGKSVKPERTFHATPMQELTGLENDSELVRVRKS